MPLPDKYVITGTPEQIATQLPLLQAMYLMMKDFQPGTGSGGGRPPISPEFDDYLQLTLHWRGITETTFKNHTVEKSVRLKNVNPKTVTLAYLQQLGRQVIAKFNGLKFKTGRAKVKYSKWKDGIHTWGYFDNPLTGFRVIDAMADIVGKPIDQAKLKYEYVANPQEAFDPTPSKIIVANKAVRPKATAPIANMHFYGATILFPWIGHEEQLCNVSGYVIRDLSFLDAYDD